MKGKFELDELVELEAIRRGIDPKIVRGMIRTESSGLPDSVSHVGARGLMQLMPRTARSLGFTGSEEDLHDPKVNIALGVEYFKQLLERYDGDVAKALSAYNQGPGNLSEKGITNQGYIDKVKNQSYQGGGKVGVFDRPVSPIRMNPRINEQEIEAIIERALSKVLGNYQRGGQVDPRQDTNMPLMGGVMGQVGNVAGNLAGFNPNITANTGNITGTAGTLSNFNPITGNNQNVLNNIIGGNSRANVSGAAQAALSQGQQAFSQLIAPEINEQFGALGLTSSGARDAAIAREAGNIGTNVGNTALLADIGAQENALNRQLSGFNPLLTGTGQRLSGLSNAGSLFSNAAGIDLDAQQSNAGMRLSGLQSAGGLYSNQAGIISGERQAGLDRGLRREVAGLPTARQPGSASVGFGVNNTVSRRGVPGIGFQSGGRVDEDDYLSNALYGVKFNKPSAVTGTRPGTMPLTGVPQGPVQRTNWEDAFMREQLKQMQAPKKQGLEDEILDIVGTLKRQAHTSSGTIPGFTTGGFDFMKKRNELTALLSQLTGASGGGSLSFQGTERPMGLMERRQGIEDAGIASSLATKQQQAIQQHLINAGINPLTGEYIGTPQKKAMGGMVQMPKDEFDIGGVVDGPAVPPDRVQINAQGGEGIIPVKMMHELEGYQSNDPMIQKIKSLMGFAGGGMVPSSVSDFVMHDAKRRTGGGDPVADALVDRELEGRLMATLLGPLAQPATVPVALAGAAYEGIKGLGQATGMGEYFPGPFKTDETSSPASGENVLALLKGFAEKASGKSKAQKKASGGKVHKVMSEFKHGTLHSGSKSGPKVTSRKQAIAIALSEQRKAKKGKYQAGGAIPTNRSKFFSPGEKAGTRPAPRFSNTQLDIHGDIPTSEVDLGLDIDANINSAMLEQANEKRRLALYDMLSATATPNVRAKLAGLKAGVEQRVSDNDTRIGVLQNIKTQREQIKSAMELQKSNIAAEQAYREILTGFKTESNNRANAKFIQDLIEQGVISPGQGGLNFSREVQGQQALPTGEAEPDQVAQAQALGKSFPVPSGSGDIGANSSNTALRGNVINQVPMLNTEEVFGFNQGDVPGMSSQEVARNAAMMQTPDGLVQLIAAYQPQQMVTPAMVAQAKKFVAMFADIPINDLPTQQAIQMLGAWLQQVG